MEKTETGYAASFFSMDTYMTVSVCASKGKAQKLLSAAKGRIEALNDTLSATKEESEISRINANAGEYVTVSAETAGLIQEAVTMAGRTFGALDISVYPIVEAWGFISGNYRVPDDAEIASLRAKTGYQRIAIDGDRVQIDPGMAIELGAIAKGYASDAAADVLRQGGVSSAMISLGGNIYALGNKPDGTKWRVGIQNPRDEEDYVGILALSDAAAVTSGDYQRRFEKDGVFYHHIIDPATGKPADSGVASVTIVAASGTYADALSTALFVLGTEKGLDLWRQYRDFEAVFVTTDGNVIATSGLRGTLTASGSHTIEFVD